MIEKKFLMLTTHNHEAIGARILSALLLRNNYHVRVLFLKKYVFTKFIPISEKEWDLFKEYVADFSPCFIGISATSMERLGLDIMIKHLRIIAPDALVACGGFGPTVDSEYFLNAGADLVVRGEGEGAILDIAKALCTNTSWKNINNISYIDNNIIIQRPLRPLISNLDTIPYPLYDNDKFVVIENNQISHKDPLLSAGIYSTVTSRGCLGRCTYCSGSHWLNIYKESNCKIIRYRRRSPENILEEFEDAKSKGISYINIQDEYFVAPHDKFLYFFNEYKKRINLPFFLQMHTGFLEKDKKRFDAFYQAGAQIVTVGVQSASKRIAKDIFHRPLEPIHLQKMIHKYYDHRIQASVHFIVGNRLENEQDFLDTLNFIKEMPYDPSWPQRTSLIIFPLTVMPEASLGKLFPILEQYPIPFTMLRFFVNIPYVRHVIKDDDMFFTIYHNDYFKENPHILINIYNNAVYSAFFFYLQSTARRLAGQEVYFYGCGELYQRYKHIFRNSKPKAILRDISNPSPVPLDNRMCFFNSNSDSMYLGLATSSGDKVENNEIDGLPIFSSEDILSNAKPLPIIIFSQNAGIISNKILRNYPTFTDIVTCQNITPVGPVFLI
jgi:radical SAM superfamily enzyme YgiQ (UPF0313 family)